MVLQRLRVYSSARPVSAVGGSTVTLTAKLIGPVISEPVEILAFGQIRAWEGRGGANEEAAFLVEKIVGILKQANVGVPATEVICKAGISEQTFYRWKKKYVRLKLAITCLTTT